jgi:hypothetical protein
MWEVRAADGRLEELLRYVLAQADPAAEVYRAGGDEPRVVVIDPSGVGVADVPDELVARPAHSWPFDRVR